MKQETWKTRVKEVGQAYQVTIVLKLKRKKDKTITHERVILTNVLVSIDMYLHMTTQCNYFPILATKVSIRIYTIDNHKIME